MREPWDVRLSNRCQLPLYVYVRKCQGQGLVQPQAELNCTATPLTPRIRTEVSRPRRAPRRAETATWTSNSGILGHPHKRPVRPCNSHDKVCAEERVRGSRRMMTISVGEIQMVVNPSVIQL